MSAVEQKGLGKQKRAKTASWLFFVIHSQRFALPLSLLKRIRFLPAKE
jgi:hypothetical protein